MGEMPKKYHVTDEGDVYRVNDDGSFTELGNADDLSPRPDVSSPRGAAKTEKPGKGTEPEKKPAAGKLGVGDWWRTNYRWLWGATLVLLIGWACLCLNNPIITYINTSEGKVAIKGANISGDMVALIICFCLSWFFATGEKILRTSVPVLSKLSQIAWLGLAGWIIYSTRYYCENTVLLESLAILPEAGWVAALYLTQFRREKVACKDEVSTK